ncbi:hypothetical protein BASA81_018601 [Batrachochytrium salamandrivorans]|nr:hypothetical protein BASA81_018601 [Batrachochytrium salamandrivorans]
MDDGLVPVLAKLIQCQHHVLQIKALELAGYVGSKLTDHLKDEFILGDWTLAMVAELQSMPAVRLSIIDQLKTMNILDVLSRLLVEYPDDTPMYHDVLKLGHHMASDMNYPPLPSAFREAIGKLVESIADENLSIAREALRVAQAMLTTSKRKENVFCCLKAVVWLAIYVPY